jgi:hypothetical protein
MTTPPNTSQFTAEELAANKELRELIFAANKRKTPVRKPKITATEQWVYDRINAAHEMWSRKAHPHFYADGHSYIPLKPIDYTLTNKIVDGIRDWIKWHGGMSDQYNVQGRDITTKSTTTATGQIIAGKTVRIKSSATVGAADITAVFRGRALKIEVKNKYTKDTIKPKQIEYQKKALSAGALHLFCPDMETFITWWDNVVMKAPAMDLFS